MTYTIVKLTHSNSGEVIRLIAEQIMGWDFNQKHQSTFVYMGGQQIFSAKESAEEIEKMILELNTNKGEKNE